MTAGFLPKWFVKKMALAWVESTNPPKIPQIHRSLQPPTGLDSGMKITHTVQVPPPTPRPEPTATLTLSGLTGIQLAALRDAVREHRPLFQESKDFFADLLQETANALGSLNKAD